MKFPHQLKFNTVPEWREHYIAYSALKKHLFKDIRSTDAKSGADIESIEPENRVPLLTSTSQNKPFLEHLKDELTKVYEFYLKKENENGRQKLEHLAGRVMQEDGLPEPALLSGTREDSPETIAQRTAFWSSKERRNQREALRSKMEELFKDLNDLQKFLQINREGFRKILKKHDKLTSLNLKDAIYPLVLDRLSDQHEGFIKLWLEKVVELYGQVCCRGDLQRAKQQLDRQLKEEIKFERNSVWLDQLAIERRTAAAHLIQDTAAPRWPWLARNRRAVLLSTCLALFAAALYVPIFDDTPKQHCFAMFVLLASLWCTEGLPLFATSMLVPLLVVVLRVLVDHTKHPPVALPPAKAAPAIFHAMFSQTIILLLGGFAIAAAMTKHFLAKQLAIAVLSRVGREPRNVLLANMLVATFVSMFISNVAAPVLCYSLAEPVLKGLNAHHPFAKALVMGIALASNLGGMTSPISSPQNIFAIERMSMDGAAPSWAAWFAVALPVAVIGNLISWGILLVVYQPGVSVKEVGPRKPAEDPLTSTQVYVIAVSLVTVVLWCCNSMLITVTGEMGVLALLPLLAFFGFGVLDKDDFKAFPWDVVMLAMGGLALGEAVSSSGLLLAVATSIEAKVQGLGLWSVLSIFCGLVLVATTLISHTVGAMVILPIVQSVGEQMQGDPHPKLLVMGAALTCSAAMGLPVSGFPNMTAVAQEAPSGDPYVTLKDFLKVGLLSSAAAYAVIVSIGYLLMLGVGF